MSIVTLADVKKHLNLPTSVDDAELQDTIDAAEAALEERLGPLTSTTVTARVPGGGTMLSPPVTPIISITSVTPVGGTALTVADLTISTDSTQIEYIYGSTFGSRRYDVVYTAGRAVLPDHLRMAAKKLAALMWRSQRGPVQVPGLGGEQVGPGFFLPGSTSEFPPDIERLIAKSEQVWL